MVSLLQSGASHTSWFLLILEGQVLRNFILNVASARDIKQRIARITFFKIYDHSENEKEKDHQCVLFLLQYLLNMLTKVDLWPFYMEHAKKQMTSKPC